MAPLPPDPGALIKGVAWVPNSAIVPNATHVIDDDVAVTSMMPTTIASKEGECAMTISNRIRFRSRIRMHMRLPSLGH